MGSRRQYDRIKSKSPCFLMDNDGDIFDALLEDISVSGALIAVRGGIPKNLNIGDICSLLLSNDITLRRSCRIVRHDSENMGISFLTAREQ